MSYRLVPWCRRAVWRRLVSCRVLRGVAWCSVVSSVVLLFSRGRGVASCRLGSSCFLVVASSRVASCCVACSPSCVDSRRVVRSVVVCCVCCGVVSCRLVSCSVLSSRVVSCRLVASLFFFCASSSSCSSTVFRELCSCLQQLLGHKRCDSHIVH